MEGAVRNGVPGLPADCGGSCACGTCRVMVDEQWLSRLDDANDLELATIEIHEDTLPGQRLSCQIPVTPDLDGIVVRIPGDYD
jgi:2Fe-2S ferredoxin